MERRQLIILCKIGDRDVSFKCITEVKVDRNFSDVGNKFAIELVDSPEVSTYDLELYMNAGYRDIIFKYGDLGIDKLTSFKGTIWDYTCTFVGNKKRLSITGICDRYINNDSGASTWRYNIDWNNYFNLRSNETQPYGALKAEQVWRNLSKNKSAAFSPEYKNAISMNAKTLSLKGPSGNFISLPIPESFFYTENIPENLDNYSEGDYPEFYDLTHDPNNKYWGELFSAKSLEQKVICDFPNIDAAETRYFKDDYVVAIKININGNDQIYISVGFLTQSWNNLGLKPTLPSDYEVYKDTSNGLAGIYGIRGPLRNKVEYFSGTKFVNVYDANNNLVGFRPDLDASKKDNAAFICVTLGNDEIRHKNINAVLANLSVQTYLHINKLTESRGSDFVYFYEKKDDDRDVHHLRGFIFYDSTEDTRRFYLQANPNKEFFGGAGIVKSGHGVDISHIVKQLAILEGWKLRYDSDGNTPDIVQTEFVPNNDAFIMQNQSAFDFIRQNLIPKAVTPLGKYVTTYGETVDVDEPQGGFDIFFDSDGYIHFQPLVKSNIEKLDIENLGYNTPNSPTISFQVNTKGTAFYNFQNVVINTTSITSGTKVTKVEIMDKQAEEINQTVGHNDTFDNWLGLKYDTVKKYTTKNNINTGQDVQEAAFNLAQNALVSSPATKLSSSGVYDATDVQGNIALAIKNIEDFTITANMNMWGDYRIKPASRIEITNYVTGGKSNSNIPQKHPSSGTYMIKKVSETINHSGYIQSLDLLRFSDDLENLINPYSIDYSKQSSENINRENKSLIIDNIDGINNEVRTYSTDSFDNYRLYPADGYKANEDKVREEFESREAIHQWNPGDSRYPTGDDRFKVSDFSIKSNVRNSSNKDPFVR